MRLLTRRRFWRRCGYLLGVAVALCAYLLTAFGFPVAVPRAAAKDGGKGAANAKAAPAAARPCGCAPVDPDEGCCCCTPKEGGGGGKSCCGTQPTAAPEEAEPES